MPCVLPIRILLMILESKYSFIYTDWLKIRIPYATITIVKGNNDAWFCLNCCEISLS